MWGDPLVFASLLGIQICCAPELPFEVGSTETTVIYRWDEEESVRDERVWIGVAQCIMTRAGIEWRRGDAAALAKKLIEIDCQENTRFIA